MKLRTTVADVMTRDPVFTTPDTNVETIARLMAERNCGDIPICDHGRVLGIVTDRDITTRSVARGLNATTTFARDVMTMLPITVGIDAPLSEAIELMKVEKLRRLPVVDQQGGIVGVISQVDIATHTARRAGELLAATR